MTDSRSVAAYLRVSSKSQDVAMQRSTIERRLRSEDVAPEAVLWYVEKASARTMDRVQLKLLREDMTRGKIRSVYTFRLDRVVRSGIRDMLEFIDLARAARCQVWSASEGYEITSRHLELVVVALGWAAEAELEAIAERRDEARARVEADGRSWGRPRRLTAADVARVKDLVDGGRSVREVAGFLGVPKSTVARALSYDPIVRPGASDVSVTQGTTRDEHEVLEGHFPRVAQPEEGLVLAQADREPARPQPVQGAAPAVPKVPRKLGR